MKVEILGNVFLNGEMRAKGDVVDTTKEEHDIVKKLDKEANREFRLKAVAKPKAATPKKPAAKKTTAKKK